MIKVLKPGLATSVQDLGREGYYHLGIPPSGALDQYALSAANHLVGNPPGAAGLECTLIGPELEFRRDALVALSGALMAPRLDGEVVHQDTAFQVRAGQVLRFEFPWPVRVPIWRSPAASTCRWCSAVARPTPSAHSVAFTGGGCRRGMSCPSASPVGRGGRATACRWPCAGQSVAM